MERRKWSAPAMAHFLRGSLIYHDGKVIERARGRYM